VAVSGARGGTAGFDVPALPAPDGSALVRAATRRMDGLSSYRVRENLSGIRSRYTYARPHRMYVRTYWGAGPSDTLWVGRAVYRREGDSQPWQLKSRGVLAPVPYFVWNPFRPFSCVRVVGSAVVAGTKVTVLSLFGGHGRSPAPVWFTVYVDPRTNLVLRSRMWAPNHFMDDRYYDVDRPVRVPSPTAG